MILGSRERNTSMQNRIADPHLGINKQARAVLAYLDTEPSFAKYENGFYDIDISTHAWYNGRERGVSLTISRLGFRGCLVVTFGECRNSDGIFVDAWELPGAPYNGPTTEGFTDDAYKARKTFPEGAAGKAGEYIFEKLADFYNTKLTEKVA